MMDWIKELQKKPNEFTISDISSKDVTGRIKSLKEELTNLRAVLATTSAEIKVDKLTGLGQSLYEKIIGNSGAGATASTLANLYDKTYRYVCKDLLKFSTTEMATINVDPTTLEQVYINYLISGLVVSLLILILPSCSEILNPYLDAIKSVITSFIVINYSDLIGLVVGESLSNACSIGSQTVKNIQKTCQIATENINDIIKDLKLIYEQVDEEDGEALNEKVYISLKDLIRQSDMPEHAEERMNEGYAAAGEEMREESQEQRSVFANFGGKRKSKKAKKSTKRSSRKQKKTSRKSKR
jgi:ribosomal protein L29